MAEKIIVKKGPHLRSVANNDKTLAAWEKIGYKPISANELKQVAKKEGKTLEEVKSKKQIEKSVSPTSKNG